MSTIFKALHCRRKDSTQSPSEHAGQQIVGACTELFYHGKEIYDERVEQLRVIVDLHRLPKHTGALPTYEEQREKYKVKYLV